MKSKQKNSKKSPISTDNQNFPSSISISLLNFRILPTMTVHTAFFHLEKFISFLLISQIFYLIFIVLY